MPSSFSDPHSQRTVPWIMQRRGALDVLVHPNSGCGLEDHTQWPLWGGNAWEINRELFKKPPPPA